MEELVVLRDLGGHTAPDQFGGVRATTQGYPGAPAQLAVEVEMTNHAGRRELARDPGVLAVAPLMPTRLIAPTTASAGTPEGDAWGLGAIGADDSTWTGAGTVVCVLDTGIDRSHLAFAGVSLTERNFTTSGTDDQVGHGTHCAATILGRDVENTRIGVARGVERALIGKVLDDAGGGSSTMVFEGIRWAMEEGAHIVSMSLGFDFPGMVRAMSDQGWPVELATSSALEAYRGNLRMFDVLMRQARVTEEGGFSTGTLFVAAAGNESRRRANPDFEVAASLPAAAENVISVAAVERDGQSFRVAPFSNTFATIAAPGVDVISAQAGGKLTGMSGTSMACPHVAGLAALWHEALRERMQSPSSRNIDAHLRAGARTGVFSPGTGQVHVGVGLASAPPNPQ